MLVVERLGAAVRRKVLYAVLGAGMLACCVLVWPFAKAHLQAVAVMREVSGQPVPWVARETTVPVTTQDLSFSVERRRGGSWCGLGCMCRRVCRMRRRW